MSVIENEVPVEASRGIDAPELSLRRVAGNIGAEVRGVRLGPDLDDHSFAQIHSALLRHKVLFFRGQHHLDDDTHQAFGARFGKPVPHPTVTPRSGTRLFELDASRGGGRADSWHTDVTFTDAFPKISILRALTTPEYGGDTVWANAVLAYEGLPDSLKRFAEGLRAVHTNDYDYGADRTVVSDERLRHHREVFVSQVHEAEHPVVHVHPETGEKALLLGHFVKRIIGLSSNESARVFELLQNRAIRPEYTVRWSWQEGDVAIWDNRATQHFAINDYGDQPRVVRRVTIEGTPAVGVDRRHSVVIRRPEAAPQELAPQTSAAVA